MIQLLIIIVEMAVIKIIGVLKAFYNENISKITRKELKNPANIEGYDYFVEDDAEFDYAGQDDDSYDYE